MINKLNFIFCEKLKKGWTLRSSASIVLSLQVGNKKKLREDKPKDEEGLGVNVKSIILVALLMMLMLFAVHCTWVTSSAYSSPSIVLASYGQNG